MKSKLTLTFCAALTISSALAGNPPSTLSWSAQDSGAGISLTDGSPLSVGAIVRLGYFDLDADQLEALFCDPAVLESHFTTLASAKVGSFESQTFLGAPELNSSGISESGAAGAFAATLNFTPAGGASDLNGKRCYIWAMNASSVAASTYHGIFSHHTWIINSNTFGGTQWDLSQVSATDPQDVILGHRGPQVSAILGGPVLRLTNTSQLKIDISDDDKDGTPALLETAFAMNPAKPDSDKLPKIATNQGRPALSFTRKSGGVTASDGSYTADGLRYVIEMSSDLKTWAPCESPPHTPSKCNPAPTARKKCPSP